MPTQVQGLTFQYGYTIGRAEFFGQGFRNPCAMARGEGDLMYVLNRGSEFRPDGKRVTMCTVGEDYIGEFARGVTVIGDTNLSSADGSLIWPASIALDSEGKVYVADEWLNRISIFTKNGEWIGKWGIPGDADGEISGPSGMAFDKDDHLYLADALNNRIQKFTKDGKFLSKWGNGGSGDGEFNLPWGITIDQKGDIFVADWRNDRIQKFTPDGQFLMKFGTSGTGGGEFNRPTGVAVDKAGIIYVTDWGNDRLQVFAPDGGFIAQVAGEGGISKWGKEKLDANPDLWRQRLIAQGLEREKNFLGPIAVVVDNEERIFVVESSSPRIQVYRKQSPVFLLDRLGG